MVCPRVRVALIGNASTARAHTMHFLGTFARRFMAQKTDHFTFPDVTFSALQRSDPSPSEFPNEPVIHARRVCTESSDKHMAGIVRRNAIRHRLFARNILERIDPLPTARSAGIHATPP